MSIAAVCVALSLAASSATPRSAQEAPQGAPKPSELVSKCLDKLATAKTMVGSIRFIQTIGNIQVQIDTNLQYELPSRLYLHQSRKSREPWNWAVTSDGVNFSYDAPLHLPPYRPIRLTEPVKVGEKSLSCREIYFSTCGMIGDKGAPLDMALGRPEVIRQVLDQWATMTLEGETKVGDKMAYVISGDWREDAKKPVTGKFWIVVSPSGDLHRYQTRETVSFDQALGPQVVDSTWEVKFELNAKPNPQLFAVIR